MAAGAWHDAFVLLYTSYLRVYEPLSAFPPAEGRRWAAYAASAARPRRASALAAEHADSVRRMLALPPIAAPREESPDAYVRWVDGVTFVCPWQTRLRCWLALARLKESAPALASAAFPLAGAEAAARQFSRLRPGDWPLRVHIQASTWSIPVEWFVPFAPGERWLVLRATGEPSRDGEEGEAGASLIADSDPLDGARATAAPTRTLIYSTTMAHARGRVTRALAAIRRAKDAPGRRTVGQGEPATMLARLEPVGRWLGEFHPQALVELDYGGLVNLLSDHELRADQSVAEVCAAVRALGMNEHRLATAMHKRVTRRWDGLESLACAS